MPKDAGQDRLLVRRYRLGRLLGSGAHGSVYLAEDLGRGGEQVALKVVEQVIGDAQPAEAERILQWFRHPNWAEILDTGRSGPRDWFQALRFVPGLNLEQVGAPQPEELVWKLLEDGARVLGALHRQGLIHYDVTPGNLILDTTSGRPRFTLTDGGLAHLGPVMGVARGTPRYMAPEVSTGAEHDHRSDLYSLGLVAYWLLTGTDPHTGGAGDVLGARRRADAPRASTRRPDVSRGLDELLASLLARNPNDRPADALALLAAIGQAQGCEVPPFLPEEIAALVAGGPLIGRGEEQERFAQSLSILAVHSGLAEEPAPRYPGTPLKDAVLVMRGPRGVGCTRLATRFAGLAREADVLVLRLSGRGGSDHSAALLPGLLQGLGLPRPRERQGASGEPRHGTQRDIERAIAALERLARKESVLLLVDSFAHLPDPDKEFVRTLARHLQARMSPGSPSALPLMLVVDAGEEPLEQFIPVTRQDSRAAEMALAPLATPDLVRVATERLGSLTLTDADGQRIAQRCEGLPGRLGSLLLEALRHGDLTYRHGTFILNPAHIDDYSLDAHLAPSLQMALQGLDDSETAFLRVLSILPEGLSVPAATAVYERLTGRAGLPTLAPLLRKTGSEPHERIHLAAPELRKHLHQASPPADPQAPLTLAAGVLAENPSSDSILGLAHLLAFLGDTSGALRGLLDAWHDMDSDMRARARGLLASAANPHDIRNLSAPRFHQLLQTLGESESSIQLAITLLPIAEERSAPAALLLQLSRALESHRHYPQALAAARIRPTRTSEEETLRLSCQQAWLFTVADQYPPARAALRTVRYRRRASPLAYRAVLADYCLAAAQLCATQHRWARAAVYLRAAHQTARALHLRTLIHRIINNQAIVLAEAGDLRQAQRAFERSLRLRVHDGDVDSRLRLLRNLSTLHRRAGEPLRAANLLSAAAGLAVRHGRVRALSAILTSLGSIYDAQGNARLAASTLHTATEVAERDGDGRAAGAAAQILAPIAAAIGDGRTLSEALVKSARSARVASTHRARAMHYWTMAEVALVAGQDHRASLYTERALRCGETAQHSSLLQTGFITLLARRTGRPARDLGPVPIRPQPGTPARMALQALIKLRRAGARTQEALQQVHISLGLAHGGAGGTIRRLTACGCLRLTRRLSARTGALVLEGVERSASNSGESQILARTLALLSVHPEQRATSAGASTFARAVRLAADWTRAWPRSLAHSPQEMVQAASVRAGLVGAPEPRTPTEYQALAFTSLMQEGAAAVPDDRRGSALHHALAAVGRMNAGGSLEELLGDIARYARQITRAERACLIALSDASDAQLQVVSYDCVGGGHLTPADLSSTVLQRVLASHGPLLLHDVFDDSELIGRPSVTGLSLRSILCVPLLRRRRLTGLLYADSSASAGSFDSVDLEVLSLFAEQAGAALETNALLRSVQQSMESLKAAQEKLIQGERLRTIGELSSSVAHEFNNLLTSILARVQLMGLAPVSSEIRRELEIIERTCLDAAEVVRRLQAAGARQREAKFHVLDLGGALDDAIEFLRPLWSTRRRHGRSLVTVRARVPRGITVRGDPTEIREVFTNLIKNALDALVDGGEIHISLSADQDRATIQISDTGPGIPDEVLAKVFDPFFTTKGDRGTGLGLCIAQQILDRHAGRLRLSSRVGLGTVAEIILPLCHLAPARPSAPALSAPLGPRVLVVDDDENVLMPLAQYLNESGYDVLVAGDGASAIEMVEQHSPRVVMSDVSMPGMSGIELCEHVRRAHPRVPVLLMSGRTSHADQAAAHRAGAHMLLAKPFSMQQAKDALAEAIKASAQMRQQLET